ncbi:MAG: sialate O-acetylesterase [Gemmataceae bacterium]
MRFVFSLFISAAMATVAWADVKPHQLFCDHMVLQRDVETSVWGTADAGETVTVTLDGVEPAVVVTAKPNDQGVWLAKLPPQKAGVGKSISLKGNNNSVVIRDVAFGEVWVCSGQSNMEWRFQYLRGGKDMAEKAVNKNIRLFTVPKTTAATPRYDVASGAPYETKWLESDPESVFTFSTVAYYFGTNLQKSLKDVPVGLIHTSWGGTPAESWASTEALAAAPDLKYYLDRKEQMIKQAGGKPLGAHTPTSLYNGMIYPIQNYAVKGAIWYQGESNAGRAAEYYSLMPTMIEDWRKQFKCELPFYLVQLAPFHAGDADGVSYAELRDAQRATTTKLKNVGMAVITDVGDLFDIHPQHKEPVGTRLAIAARAMTYGQKIESSGPVYKSMTIDGNKAVLSFDHLGGGLVAKGGNMLNGFTICGEDRDFYPAKATIKGDTVVVTCSKVAKPVAVRFGWNNFPVCNLFNKAQLPASPFRTDDFPLTTQYPGKK